MNDLEQEISHIIIEVMTAVKIETEAGINLHLKSETYVRKILKLVRDYEMMRAEQLRIERE